MNVYKNIEIAREYNVSNPTVMRWIDAAVKGKNNLQLDKVKNKFRIIKSEHNSSELRRLSEQGFVFKNKIQKSEVKVSKETSEIFSKSQIIELINELKTNRHIPLKFTYLNGGADIWNNYVNQGLANGNYLVSEITDKLILQSFDFISEKIKGFSKINVVDIGPGNAYPIKNFLLQLTKIGLLHKYIVIDISANLIEMAEKNVKTWIPNIKMEKYIGDIAKNDISEILFENKDDANVFNLVFFVGDTYGNIEDRQKLLKNLRGSLDDEDILVISNKLSKPSRYSELSHLTGLIDSLLWIPRLLNIEVNKCEIVRRFEPKLESRAIYLKPDKDYNIIFDLEGKHKSIKLIKGEEIRLWKHHMSTLSELSIEFADADLEPVHFTTTRNLSHAVIISEPIDKLS